MSRNPSFLVLLISDGMPGFILCNMCSKFTCTGELHGTSLWLLRTFPRPSSGGRVHSEKFYLVFKPAHLINLFLGKNGSSDFKLQYWEIWQEVAGFWRWRWCFLQAGSSLQTAWGVCLGSSWTPHHAPPAISPPSAMVFSVISQGNHRPWLNPEHWETVLQSIYALLPHSITSCHTG